MPNVLRRSLKVLACLCDEKLSGDPTIDSRWANFDSATLDRAVSDTQAMLTQIHARKPATELANRWRAIVELEDEIEDLVYLNEQTAPALRSWRQHVMELRDFARQLADSKKVAAAEGQMFNQMIDAINNKPASPFIATPLQATILKALDGKAMKKAELAKAVCAGDDSRLYKPGGLNELRANGKIDHKQRVGYFRPDAPPPGAL